jgi:hypothetical protein|tara:strand:- start:44 stop:358 length:315 start_codon:yes stop_codon:yes gene_type:complete
MKNLFDKLKFNGAHMDDKKALTIEQLQTLADAKYSDISWGNNECASFGSDCLRYELLVQWRTDNVSDKFHAVHYKDDGDCTFFHSGDNLAQCLAAIESHNRGIL